MGRERKGKEEKASHERARSTKGNGNRNPGSGVPGPSSLRDVGVTYKLHSRATNSNQREGALSALGLGVDDRSRGGPKGAPLSFGSSLQPPKSKWNLVDLMEFIGIGGPVPFVQCMFCNAQRPIAKPAQAASR